MLEQKALKGSNWREKMCVYGGLWGFPVCVLMAIIFRKHEFAIFFGLGLFAFLVIGAVLVFFRISPKCPYCGKRTKQHYDKDIDSHAILYICKRCRIFANSGMGTE